MTTAIQETLMSTTTPSRPAAARPRPSTGASRDVAIEVEHLDKRYDARTVLDDVSFSVKRGEVFAILGPNGAGKTTTVEVLQGLRSRDGGMVRVLGLDPQRDGAQLRRRIGSQLQASALPARLKVWEALDLFGSVNAGGNGWPDLLEAWGLSGQRNTSFADLSGGQRQRLFVALALLGSPEVVFLDELTQGLDPAARRVAWGLIREIRDRGTTVVLVTHYMDEAEHLADRLAMFDRGRLVAAGTAQELIARSKNGIAVRFSTDPADLSFLEKVNGVSTVGRRGPHIEVRGTGPLLALVGAALVDHGIIPADLHLRQPTLEDAYMELLTSGTQENRR
jgi:ABC-2 type transport system ATP-binding protein